MYTGTITLSLANLPEVLRLADFLRMRELMSLCCDFMDTVRLEGDPSLCLCFLHLIDSLNLVLVSPSMVDRVRGTVSVHLRAIFAAVDDDTPAAVAARLLDDAEIGSVPEPEICAAVCRLAAKRPGDGSVLDLLDGVEFEYLSAPFVRQNVLPKAEVVSWLERRRPEVLASLIERVDRHSVEGVVDIVICGIRDPSTHYQVMLVTTTLRKLQ